MHLEEEGHRYLKKVNATKLSKADTTIGGMKIEIEDENAEQMKMLMDGNWMDHHAEDDAKHIEIELADTDLDAHASKIFYSDRDNPFLNYFIKFW